MTVHWTAQVFTLECSVYFQSEMKVECGEGHPDCTGLVQTLPFIPSVEGSHQLGGGELGDLVFIFERSLSLL